MISKRLFLALLLLGAATTAVAVERFGVGRHRAYPPCRTGIPPADYQYGQRSRSVFAVSQRPVPLDSPLEQAERLLPASPAPVTRTERTVITRDRTLAEGQPIVDQQQEQTTVTIDRTVAPPPDLIPLVQRNIRLYQWTQPPLQVDHCVVSQPALHLHRNGDWVLSLRADQNPHPEPPDEPVYNPWLFIKRNQFMVRLRCYGSFATPPTEAAPAAGKPILAELDAEPFWVQRGEPRHIRTGGYSSLVQQHFERIDRVQIEFFYR